MWVATSWSWSESNEVGQVDLTLSRAIWQLHLSYDTVTAAWLTGWRQGTGYLTVKCNGRRENVFIFTHDTNQFWQIQPLYSMFVCWLDDVACWHLCFCLLGIFFLSEFCKVKCRWRESGTVYGLGSRYIAIRLTLHWDWCEHSRDHYNMQHRCSWW